MKDAIAISPRAADSVRQMLEQLQRLQDSLRTYVEALGAQLDVPPGWRFDVQTLTFIPPPEQPSVEQPSANDEG